MRFRIPKAVGLRTAAVATTLIISGALSQSASASTGSTTDLRPPIAPISAPSVLPEAQITVGNYNVCAEHCSTGTSRLRYNFNVRASKIAAQVLKYNVDVLGVEEVGPSASSMRKLAKQMKYKGYNLGANKGGRGMFYRSSVFANTDPAGHKLAGRGYRVKAPGANSRGGSIQVLRHRATGQYVIFTVAHLSALDGTKQDKARLVETQKVRALISPYKARYPTATVIWAGDFNSLSHSNTGYESDTARWRVNAQMSAYGYTDGFTKAINTGSATRLSSLNKQPGDRRNFPPAFQLDRIYTDDWAEVLSFNVVSPRPGGYKNQWSDHNMIHAKVVIYGA
jgi:endonuclease/exonuclease/phosphatase family metal-dependent hydrolase